MPRNIDSPVQTQMAVAALNQSLRGEFHGSNKNEGRPSGRGCVFVQTDTGCVLGIELDHAENVHTVKRKLQLAINAPMEENSLTIADLGLKNDLSTARSDASLILTRNYYSPTGKNLQQKDKSTPVEILGCSSHCSRTKQLVKDVMKSIKNGVDPIPAHGGLGGAYYFRNNRGQKIAIVKPTDEEPFAPNNPKGFIGKALGQPGLKRSVRVGETGFREVAAYLLDYDNYSNVPPTALVNITHSIFHVNEGGSCNSNNDKKPPVSKTASFQQFIPHDYDASDHGTSSFPVADVHRIGILDVRIFNTDRHAGNILVRKIEVGAGQFGGLVELIPIDHGLCLPESLDDPYFEWMHWPQASIPFSDEELEYIANLDPVRDSEMLRMELPMIREACLRVLILCTIFLKEAAAYGLCLAEIGEMMSREFKGMVEEPSELEVVCIEARRLVADREVFPPSIEVGDNECLFDIDCDEGKTLSPYHFGLKGGGSRTPFSKLESLDEEEEEDEESSEHSSGEEATYIPTVYERLPNVYERLPNVPKLSMSLKGVSLTEKSSRYQGGFYKGDNSPSKIMNGSSRGVQVGNSRSADEQLLSSASFVKLADMGEEEWAAFLEKFQELLHGTFRGRKARPTNQRQRLGTSCQF